MKIEHLVEEIYKAAIAPEYWLRTLDQISAIADAEGAYVFALHNESRALVSNSFEEKFKRLFAPEWTKQNERMRHFNNVKEQRFLSDLDIFSIEALDTMSFYRELLRPIGLGWSAWTTINSPTEGTLVFCIERAYEKGPIPEAVMKTLNDLRPHLERACALAAEAGHLRTRSGVLALESVGLPAAILSEKGKVLAFNSLFDKTISGVAVRNGEILKFRERETQSNFLSLIANNAEIRESVRPGSFILHTDTNLKPYIAHIFPLGYTSRDVFTGASLLFYVTPLAGQATMPAQLLQELFDLTPAEANIARLIGEGNTISSVSAILTIQESTVRVHLKSIFSKTGVNRQSDLVRLVMMPWLKTKISSDDQDPIKSKVL